MHSATLTRGFTLIELLVVIAIIGILSSVVLASLNTARAKGSDAAIKSDINGARAQAELYYDASPANGYTNVCTAVGGIAAMVNAITAQGVTPGCNGDATHYILWAPLKTTANTWWCTDQTGTSTLKGAAPGSTATSQC
jgi:prepilin-type N-terminal cleavage/methylation domain-containing protein